MRLCELELMHYTAEPLVFDASRKYEDHHRWHWKPSGLWVSVRGDDDWPSWCRGESWGEEGLVHASRIHLRPTANVRLISADDELHVFSRAYGRGDDMDLRDIDWGRVKERYDGLIIAPYQPACHFDLMWYYGWDCASGVIWNLDAIASVEPIAEVCCCAR